MATNGETDAYQTYLLRLWRARCKGHWQWRVSIESPRTGERLCFATLEAFYAYLSERCEGEKPEPGRPRLTARGSERK